MTTLTGLTGLTDLAQKLDCLDPETAWKERVEIAEQMKAQLGDRHDEFERRFEALLKKTPRHPSPAALVLSQMGPALPAEKDEAPAPEAEASETPAPPKLVLNEACARLAHEANRIYCAALGDLSQFPWSEAPDWQRSSALQGVAAALAGSTPEQLHASWLADKERAGWKHGPIKDPDKKEHPCMVPYAQLSFAQQRKDGLFLAVVQAMAAALAPAPALAVPTEEDHIAAAAAAYRRHRTLAQQAQAAESELARASAAWTAARDSFERGSPGAAKLEQATTRIDQEIAEAKRRPPQFPTQLPGAIRRR